MTTDKLMRSTPGFDRSTVPGYTKEEAAIIRHIRKIGYGEVTVKVRDCKPVLVTENKTIKLD